MSPPRASRFPRGVNRKETGLREFPAGSCELANTAAGNGQRMDSTLIVVREATAAVSLLTGTLWVFAGLFCVMVCGYLIVRYTLRG